jgi:hypothetical protein
MHTAPPYGTKDEMANSRDETFIEKADSYSADNGDVGADEKAMTRRILLNLDFRYEMSRLVISTSCRSSS